jgi:ribokinase
MVDILVVNAIEAEMMGTAPVTDLPSALAAAQTLSARFPAVVVTAGAQGLALVTADESLTLPAEDVQAVSSHGAGDAFTGTLAAELARRRPAPGLPRRHDRRRRACGRKGLTRP